MKIIDDSLLKDLAEQAQRSPRLRMNYNFHQSLDDKCHRFLNALEIGTEIPIHRHPTKDETFLIIRGKVRVNIYDDKGNVVETVILSQSEGNYGADIPKNTWHTVECLEPDSILFEAKEGPYISHEQDGILEL